MKPETRRSVGFFAPLLVICIGIALMPSPPRTAKGASGDTLGGALQPVNIGFPLDQQRTAYRTSISGADTLTFAGITGLTEFKVNGRENISVSARFSNSGQTCTILLAAFHKDEVGTNQLLGVTSAIVLTAGSVQDTNSKFIAPTYTYQSFGANTCRLVVSVAPSAGSVDLWLGSY